MKIHAWALLLIWLVSGVSPAATKTARILTEEEQNTFLATRTAGSLADTFKLFCEFCWLENDVFIYSDIEGIGEIALPPVYPRTYRPTWRELFNTVARITHSSWHYDPQRRGWIFGPEPQPLPFTISRAADWQVEDRGQYVFYRPPQAPVGMDVYMLGEYSPDKGQTMANISRDFRECNALLFIGEAFPDLEASDMQRVTIGGMEALYFTTHVKKSDTVWRQWSLAENGRSFLIVSAIKSDIERSILPAVEAMVQSFRMVDSGR